MGCSGPAFRSAGLRDPASSEARDVRALQVVFGVDGTLIQGIPANKVGDYDSKKVLKFDSRFYRVADDAVSVLRRLAAEPGLDVSIFSEFSRSQTDAILSGLAAMNPSEPPPRSYLKMIKTAEDLAPIDAQSRVTDPYKPEGGRKNLKKFGSDLDQIVLVDNALNAVLPEQQGSFYYYSHPYFAFESFRQARASRDELKARYSSRFDQMKDFFPSSEEEWRNHSKRMAALFYVFRNAASAAERSSAPFGDLVRFVAKTPVQDQISEGLEELSATSVWDIVEGRVSGCALKTKDGRFLRTVDVAQCEVSLGTRLAWWGANKNQCALTTAEGIFIRNAPAGDCVHNVGGYRVWLNRDRSSCGLFADNLTFADRTTSSDCDANSEVFFDNQRSMFFRVTIDSPGQEQIQDLSDPLDARRVLEMIGCSQPFGPVSAKDSPNRDYFEKLLKRGEIARLEEFLKLWYPDRGGAVDDSFIQRCQTSLWSRLKSNGDYLTPECSPDVLYSWGPREKMDGFKRTVPDDATWSSLIHRPPSPIGAREPLLYATISPVATYAYGLIPVRLKIKKGTSYKLTSNVQGSDREIVYYPWPGEDFILKTGTYVENWSYGTPEHYDEIVRDIRWIASGKPGIVYYGAPNGQGLERVNSLRVFDGHEGGEPVLKKSLLEMIRMILSEEGRIYYQKGSCRNRTKAFQVPKPTYFAPFKLETKDH